MGGKSSRQNTPQSTIKDRSFDPYSLPLEDLRKITNNFSDERLLGQGGFGKVYKGVVQNGDTIAVKKLSSTAPGLNDRQLENEVHLLMRLNHPNIVQLVGYCSETEIIPVRYNGKHVYAEKLERLLCLEYMPKGSLHEHLSDESSGLDWDTRYSIIEGICYGLHYLHEEWNVNTPIIHMDLKPPNILLDYNMAPKITDFGLSRLFGQEQTRSITRSCNGTLGYMAPEYLNGGVITKKLDIFSLGVIIIEIMTGHKEYPYDTETSPQKFIELVLNNWINRLVKAPGYPSLEIDHCQQIRRCIQIGLACVEHDWKKRPTTHHIIKMLQGSEGVECNNTRETYSQQDMEAWQAATSSGTDHIGALVRSLCSPERGEQRFGAAQLRLLAQRSDNNRICIAEAGAIPLLLTLLSSSDLWAQEQAVAALGFLTLHEDNKARIMSSGAVPSIVHALKNGSIKAREYAAETLHRLSTVDEHKVTIGETEAIPALVVLLREASCQEGRKSAVAALFYLCTYQGNKGRAIRAGLVPLVMGLVTNPRGNLTEGAMAILAMLSRHPLGNAAIRAAEPVPVLVEMLGRGAPRSRESAIDVMLQLCGGEHQLVHLTRAQEGRVMVLLRVVLLRGTEGEKKSAGQLLERMRRLRARQREEQEARLPVGHGPPAPPHPSAKGAPPRAAAPVPRTPHRAATLAAKGAPRTPHRAAATAPASASPESWPPTTALPPPTPHRHHILPTLPRSAPSSCPTARSPLRPPVHAPLSPATLARLHQAVTLPLPPQQPLPPEVHHRRRPEATAASPPRPHSASPSLRSAREMRPRQPRTPTARGGVRLHLAPGA